uniref:VWFA domain-containing protein n=1 Tax=Acrobeloides nanus TaxID=290746 RepID=A0A914D067_9BILA
MSEPRASIPVIGIDLGTTFTVAGVRKNLTASCVYYGDRETLIGDPAKKKMAKYHGKVIYDQKRLIGKSLIDEKIERSKKFWTFNLQAENDGKPFVLVNGIESKIVHPEEVSAAVIGKMLDITEKSEGFRPKQAVITVPAYFNQAQKQATMEAAQKAGLEVLQLVTEPAAAAFAFTFDREQFAEHYNLLVYDFGGGTFDVVVIDLNNGNLEVKSICGDTHLGGRDLDDLLAEYVMNTASEMIGFECVTTSNNRARLMEKIEALKIELSSSEETNIYLGDMIDGFDEDIVITREKFEDLCEDCINQTIQLTERCLRDAGMPEIQEVILVGGSSRIPMVRRLLQELFPGKTLNYSIDADEAVAYGAALVAAKLSGALNSNQINLSEATPLSIGTEIGANGRFDPIIYKNSKVPAFETMTIYTMKKYQDSLGLLVYEGERPMVNGNNKIGELIVLDIIPDAPGKQKVEFTLSLDQNGILSVTSNYNGRIQNMQIDYQEARRHALRDIDELIDDAERYRHIDLQEEKRLKKRDILYRLLQEIDYNIDQIFRKNEKTSMRTKWEEIQKWYDNNPEAPEIDIDNKIEQTRGYFGSHAASSDRKIDEVFRDFRISQNVDLCFLVDTTGSMGPYIDGVRNSVYSIVEKLTKERSKLGRIADKVHLAFIAYRDYGDSKQFEVFEFNESVEAFHKFVGSLIAYGGGDVPEDVFGGIEKMLNLSWSTENAFKVVFHIADAPCHGRDFHALGDLDSNAAGDPNGRSHIDLFKQIRDKGVEYYFGKINNSTDLMVQKFSEAYGSPITDFNIANVANIRDSVVSAVTATVRRGASNDETKLEDVE